VRIGTIELVEDVPNSDKLVKLTVDFGDHKRCILVGLKKERDNPKSEVGGFRHLGSPGFECLVAGPAPQRSASDRPQDTHYLGLRNINSLLPGTLPIKR
jgi:hypothetical protein